MKKRYIKFKEGDEKSLQRAVQKAKRLGYEEKTINDDALKFEWNGILTMDADGEYFTSIRSENELKEHGYKEHKIEPQFEEGDYVYVKNHWSSRWRKRIYITTKHPNAEYPYVAVYSSDEEEYHNWKQFATTGYDQIKPCPQKITIKTEEGEKMEITKKRAKDLWFKLNN